MNPVEKLALLRAEMAKRHIDAYVVVTDDFHTSEYVGAHFKAREFLSGFTGSAGTLVVLPDAAALWTDGRYFLQASQQLEGSGIELMRMGQPGVPEIPAFLRDHEASVQAGAGIVLDSVPATEWQETRNKAEASVESIQIAAQLREL